MGKLLSICVPTYNRANRLSDLLSNISNEISGLSELIEVIVVDNNSSDNTEEIVNQFLEKFNLSYYRNVENIGISANIYLAPTHASGQFCWIVGDDDLFVTGSLKKIIKIIQANPNEIGYVVGYSYVDENIKDNVLSNEFTKVQSSPIFGTMKVEKICLWEETFLFSNIPALYTSIVSVVFSREEWLKNSDLISSTSLKISFKTVESTFPHTLIWAKMFSGKSVYINTQPFVYFFIGAQEWLKPKWASVLFTFCIELCDKFRQYGAAEESVRHYENCILSDVEALNVLLKYPTEYSKKHFKLGYLIKRFGTNNVFVKSLVGIILKSPGYSSKLFLFAKLLLLYVRYPYRFMGIVLIVSQLIRTKYRER